MSRIKPRGRYMAISVPIALHDEISEWVKQSSYNSIAAFVQAAVREKMDKSDKTVNRYNVFVAKEKINEKPLTQKDATNLGQRKIIKKEFDKWFEKLEENEKMSVIHTMAIIACKKYY